MRPAILAALMLAALGCGSGSVATRSEVTPQAQMPGEADIDPAGLTGSMMLQGDTATEEDVLAEDRRRVERAMIGAEDQDEAAADAAVQETRLKAVADFVPYVPTGGHAEFDGSDVRVYLPIYAGGYPVVLNSVLDETGGRVVPSRVAGYPRRVWTLFDNGPLAVVSVRWNDRDDGDYLAGGWWVRETFGRNDMEAGAFVDGPELRGPLPDSMTLPLRGQAVYYGEASGFYQTRTRVHCTAFPCDIPSLDSVAGEFVAEAKLVANFTRGDVEGCVGCRQGILFTSATYDLDSGHIGRGSAVLRDYLFWLHRAGFLEAPHSKGTFVGSLTVVPLGGRAAGYGSWQGRLSNLADRQG